MKVLVVEDEKKVLSFLKRGFKENGFTVDTAENGQEAYFLATGEAYDCMVLDIMMPGLDGYEVTRQLRKKNVTVPIIFLTAKDAVEDRVKGLETGADDYLVKPFAFSELLARVRALVRRGKEVKSPVLSIADLTVDPVRRIVKRGEKAIELTPKEFNLLQYLVEHQGEVVTRTMISEKVWNYHFDSMTNVIDVHVNNLRKKIDGNSANALLHTVRGVGYIVEERKSAG